MHTTRTLFFSLCAAIAVVFAMTFVGSVQATARRHADMTPAQETSAQSADLEQRPEDAVIRDARRAIREGRRTFRFDTFGDETFWGDQLQLHLAIEGARFGGAVQG